TSCARTWSDAACFTDHGSTGAVTFNAVPDYESQASYSFSVKASDASGAFNSQAVTVNVTDLAPVITSATTASVAEGTPVTTVVYTAAATDVAGGTVSYAHRGGGAAAFTIDGSTGAVSFNAVPDYETKSSYSFTLEAADASGATSSQAVTISVTDVAPVISSASTASVAEGTAVTAVVYTAAASDVAGGAVSYALTGGDAAAFTIDANSGAVSFNAVPDYETKSSYSFTLEAADRK